eukprot:8627154-Pyramimonas_sp.AAC.1
MRSLATGGSMTLPSSIATGGSVASGGSATRLSVSRSTSAPPASTARSERKRDFEARPAAALDPLRPPP